MINIYISMNDPRLLDWRILASGGLIVERTVNLDLRTFITRELEIPNDYLEERIQTIFLDGSPVDEVDEAMIRPGQELTLCTALPGAMGICMRRDSPLKFYRPGIGHCEDCEQLVDPIPGRIQVKYLNFIAREQGPKLFGQGVILPAAALLDHLETRDKAFWEGVVGVTIDGEPVQPEELPIRLEGEAEVALRVSAS